MTAVTARLAEVDGTWRLELDGRPVDMGTVPELDHETEDVTPRLLATRVAEWSLLDRGWKPAGGWTWDEGVATAGLVDAENEPPPSAAVVGAELADTLDLVDEAVAAITPAEIEVRLQITLAREDPTVRFGIRVLRETPAHVTFQLSSATGGQWLGGVGQMTMATAEFRVFRLILGPLLRDRPDPH